jgi:hypothetical protein
MVRERNETELNKILAVFDDILILMGISAQDPYTKNAASGIKYRP